MEVEKLAPLQKQKERAQGALEKAKLEEQSFARATQEKLRRSMEVNKENRDAQIQSLQLRLRDHVSTLLLSPLGTYSFVHVSLSFSRHALVRSLIRENGVNKYLKLVGKVGCDR